MWLQILIAAVFIAMMVSLAIGAGFLLRDSTSSHRLLTSLKWRVGLATLLMILIIFGFWSGQLG